MHNELVITNYIMLLVSENFGGWLVTGKIEDMSGITIE